MENQSREEYIGSLRRHLSLSLYISCYKTGIYCTVQEKQVVVLKRRVSKYMTSFCLF
uniref:Uncharacterized protein n=1 Tax=Musa acuminata subsp. malaccensis TaxID=214687 RepID=A0A804KEM0_MUSAM